MLKRYLLLSFLLLPTCTYAGGTPDTFLHTLDVEGSVFTTGKRHNGAQTARIRTRFIDPDVNAFVGLLTYMHHFNQDLTLFDPNNPERGSVVANWGGDFGIIRGRSLWELDVMGVSFKEHLGFSPTILGEHHLTKQLVLFHTTTLDMFVGDTLVDSDQGLRWEWKSLAVSAGYRIFSGKHLSRNGPSVGLLWHFESPKIPFLFPSVG